MLDWAAYPDPYCDAYWDAYCAAWNVGRFSRIPGSVTNGAGVYHNLHDPQS